MHALPCTPAHAQALATLLDLFDATGLWYRATGGLAGNLHGSRWPLHDIDIDYRRADWPRLAAALGAALVEAPAPYEDDEFRLVLARADIAGVAIELCQLEDAWVAGAHGWQALPEEPDEREPRPWGARQVWCLPLASLIAYKSALGRAADLADLRGLAAVARI